MDFNIESVINVMNMVLLGVFIGILAILVIAFLRGLGRGWAYGTYRLVFMGLLIVGAILSLRFIGNGLADVDLVGLGVTGWIGQTEVSFPLDMGGGEIQLTAPITTIRETGVNLITQALQASGIEADPTTLLGLATAVILSFVCVILLVIEALVIWIVGGLLCTLLWHLLFKHFLSSRDEDGEKVKKLKIISAIEEVLVSAAILAMFISPLTSLVNVVSKTYSKIPKGENHAVMRANDEWYGILTDVVDTYENSLLSKTFFGWYTDPETGLTFDAALIDFITTVDVDGTGEKKISVLRELKNVVELAGTALNAGIFTEENLENFNFATLLTSDVIPTAIRCVGRSELIQTILPFGLQFALNLPEIAEVVMTEEGIDFEHYDPAETFDDLANLWESVANSGIISDVVDEEGNFVSDSEDIANLFKPEYCDIFDSFFDIFSNSEKKVLDDIIRSALYVQAVREYEEAALSPDDGTIKIGVKDLLPELTAEDIQRSERGYVVAIPQAVKDIDFGREMQVIFDSFYHLVTIDPQLIKIVIDSVNEMSKPEGESGSAPSSSGSNQAEEMFKELIPVILENKDEMEHWIDGKEAEGTSADDTCLFDSTLLANAVPTFLKVLEDSMSEAFSLSDADAVDLSDLTNDLKSKETMDEQKTAIKTEVKAMFNVLTPLLDSEDGKELIENFDKMPGLYFDPNDGSKFLGAKDGLLHALANSVRNLDDSKVFTKVLPAALSGFLSGDNSALKNLFGDDLTLDTDPRDNAGNSILGSEFAKLIDILADCQDVIGFAYAMEANGTNMSVMEKTFSHMCSLETPNHEKQLVKLLAGFADNKILNPEVGGKKNYNFYGLFKTIFASLELDAEDLDATLESIICDDGFDANGEVSSFVDLIQYICDKGLLGSLQSFSLDSMSDIKFEELFSKVDGSELLTSVLGSVIDKAIQTNDLFTYVNDGGETVALSFKNITDWTAEGRALDTMTKYAAQFGDLSNMDLESIDPEMMESMFDYLANSQLFVKTNANGTYNYNFPNYIASKLIEAFKGAGKMGTYFANLTEDYDGVEYQVVAAPGTESEDYSDFKARVTYHALENEASLAAVQAKQALFANEGEIFGRIIRNLASSGAFSLMEDDSSADLSKFKVEYFRALLHDMSSSVLFGKTGVPAVLKVVVDTLSTSVDTFKNANIMYAYTCNDAERLAVADSIADILTIVTDPVSGLLGGSGEIDTHAFENLSNLDANHLIAPLLKTLADSQVFNSLSDFQTNTAHIEYSAFDEQMVFVLKQTSWYGSDEKAEALYPTLKGLVDARGGWDGEIDRFVEIVDDLHVMGINLDSSFDFNAYFQEARFGEDILADLFIDINDSCLLYPGFPEKLDSALSTVNTSLASSGLNLNDANLYYAGYANVPGSTTDKYAPVAYGEDECYNLASVIHYGSALSGGIDINDLAAIPAEEIDDITDLLATFAKSHIFNSKKEGSADTVFQQFMVKILTTNEKVQGFMYDANSPKDDAFSASYHDAAGKAKYLANQYYPEVALINTNANNLPTENINGDGKNSIKTLLVNFTSSSTLLDDLANNPISELSAADLSNLLVYLNDCDWTYDAVPNAIAKAIGEVSLTDVKLTRSNPYYCYSYAISYDEDTDTYIKPASMVRFASEDYSRHYDNEEILGLAETISLISDDPGALTDFSSKANITKVRNILDSLNESYIFSKDGPCYTLEDDDNIAVTKTDLTVFKQAMYKVFNDSTLADLCYNDTIDNTYASSGAKLLAKVSSYPDDMWEEELADLIINDTQDAGLLCKAYDLGIISGSSVSVDTDTLESLTPAQIGELLYAINEVDMIREIIPIQATDFLTNKLHFTDYSVAKVVYAPNATTFEIPVKTPVKSLKITYSGSVAPEVSYLKANVPHIVAPTDVSAGVKQYDITDIVLGDSLSVTCAANMTKVELSFDTNAMIGMSKERLDTLTAPNTHKGAIKSFIDLVDRLYDDGTGTYMDLGANPTAIATLFAEGDNLTALANFAKNGDSIYTKVYDADNKEAASGVFTGGDVVLSNLLKFNNSGTNVNLAKYLPNYDETAEDMTNVYKDLYEIFVGENQNCLTAAEIADVTEWLDANVMDVAYFYGVYENAKAMGMVMLSNGIDSVPASPISGKTLTQYITLSASCEWNTFEGKFKSGFGRVFYEDMREYAIGNARFNGGHNFTSVYRPSAADFEGFIELMREKLIVLMKNIKSMSISNKPTCAAILNEFSSYTASSTYADVVMAFYEGSIYECLRTSDAAHFYTQPSTYSTPFGASGYFKHAATSLSA